MSAYDVVFSALTADAALTALVPADRIQARYVRDNVVLPNIAYIRNGTAYDTTIHVQRALGADSTFAIVCHASTETEIDQIGDAVERVSGLMPLDRTDDFDPDGIFITTVTVSISESF